MKRARASAFLRWIPVVACVASVAGEARSFPYVVKKGETLADIATRFYGRVELERVLVPANALDVQNGAAVVPGVRLEIPAVGHHVVVRGDTWESLAERYLGARRRAEALAVANGTWPWLAPELGREVRVPFNLRYVVKRGDSTPAIAYRFLEKRDEAYVLDRYNDLGGEPVEPGDVLLIPLGDLELTDEGKRAAREGLAYTMTESGGDDRDAQDAASAAIPELEKQVYGGAYVEAIAKGNALLGSGKLTDAEIARIERQLVEAYVALDEDRLAEEACRAYRAADPEAELDPVLLSPKIMHACTVAWIAAPSAPRTPASASASAEPTASASAPAAPRPVRR
ncbi:MAG: LysM domain-containing protein [Polyangiaceae bacterium]